MKLTTHPMIYNCNVNSFSNEFNSGSFELMDNNSKKIKDPTREINRLITNQKSSLTIIFFILWSVY